MREAGVKPGDVEVIGFDGQTIYQEPPIHARLRNYDVSEDLVSRWLDGPYGCGLQIGEPAIVAEACETPTVPSSGPWTMRSAARARRSCSIWTMSPFVILARYSRLTLAASQIASWRIQTGPR